MLTYAPLPRSTKLSIRRRRTVARLDEASATVSETEQLVVDYLARNGHEGVLLAGFKKSGNTWLRFLIFNYFNVVLNDATETLSYAELRELQAHMLERGSTQPFVSGFPKLYRTHLPYRRSFEAFHSVLYVWRNPLDVLISYYYFYLLRERPDPLGSFAYPEESGKIYRIDDFVLSQLHYWIQYHRSMMSQADVVLSYEGLQEAPSRELTRVLTRIGEAADPTAVDLAVSLSDAGSIQKMGRSSNDIRGMANSSFKGEFVRSGQSGQWRAALRPATVVRANKQLREFGVDLELG